LDLNGFAVGIEIAGKAKADRDNAAEKLRQGWAREKLVELANELPGGSLVGIDPAPSDALDLTPATIESWVAKLQGPEALFITQSVVPRDEPALASEAFIGTVVEYVS